uniref:Uncharacterized protein n=1 Tax=Magallana gigas TaxID=29159 RepID=K1QKP7_MAGGI
MEGVKLDPGCIVPAAEGRGQISWIMSCGNACAALVQYYYYGDFSFYKTNFEDSNNYIKPQCPKIDKETELHTGTQFFSIHFSDTVPFCESIPFYN